jgi:hypothetical protein
VRGGCVRVLAVLRTVSDDGANYLVSPQDRLTFTRRWIFPPEFFEVLCAVICFLSPFETSDYSRLLNVLAAVEGGILALVLRDGFVIFATKFLVCQDLVECFF